ncbi:hypothetical protein V9J15_02070 [Candidatus Liberibacter africanus]|uniref:hypothetical protein n=1 Tax=Liberibacter africanus TaxID=34020 RepID=UPI00339D864A
MNVEPDPDYEVELVEKLEGALKTVKSVMKFRDKGIQSTILEELIEEVKQIIVLAKSHKRRLELKLSEGDDLWSLLDDSCEDCEHPDEEHKRD